MQNKAVFKVEGVQLKSDATASARGKEEAKSAEKRKKTSNESLEDAWDRIVQTKAYQTKKTKLDEVRREMMDGKLGREIGASGKLSVAECERLYQGLQEKRREKTLQDMVKNTPKNYELITTINQMESLVASLKQEKIIAVDSETTGVDVYTDVIVGISFTLPTVDKHVYIPVDHTENGVRRPEQLSLDYVINRLKPILYDKSIGKVLHNAVFDIAMFRRHGSDLLGVVWDTMTAMHVLNENEPSFKLKDLAPKYLGVESDTFSELFGKKLFSEVPLDIALVYGAKDTHLTWVLYRYQLKHLEKMPTILDYYRSVEVPLLYVIVAMEANGYILDLDFAREYGEKLHKQAEELNNWLIEFLTPYHDGEEVLNLNSSQQMRPALSKAIGKELPNMDAKKTLKPLKGEFEVVAKLLEYKKVTKLSGTYIDALPLKQNPTTKRWHSRYNPMGTVTGRFSSGKDEEDTSGQGFNAQNQPQEARPMFVAPPGKVLVGADFKAQEIRCVAYMSGEPILINAFLRGRDPYASMASTFYKRPYEEVFKNPDGSDTKERKQMKVVWLATLYGMSDFSLSEMLGVDKKAATQFKEDLFGSMPRLNAWLKENEDFVRKNGYVWADKQARKRRLPDAKLVRKQIPYGKWKDPQYEEDRLHNAKIGRALRQATNARVQGSSSIQTKKTMLEAHDYCETKDDWCLWATVHDELLFEIPEDFTQEEAQAIRDIMINSYPWGDVVPNGTDIEVMKRWGEGIPVDRWFAQTKGDVK